jgi:hypothetical protein
MAEMSILPEMKIRLEPGIIGSIRWPLPKSSDVMALNIAKSSILAPVY